MIGTVGTQSGVLGAIIGPGVNAVRAWVEATNTKGGLACHQIRYVVADDGGDPARNQALTQRLVEQDHVIAFVHVNAPLGGQASQAYINRKHIPVIGSDGSSDWYYSSPYYFPQAATGLVLVHVIFGAVSRVGAKLGLTKLAGIACIEAPLCSSFYSQGPQIAPTYHLDLVYNRQVSLVQPDFTSQCQGAKEAGAQIFFVGLDVNSLERVVQSCNSVNYHPLYTTPFVTLDPSALKLPALEGLVIGSPVAPYTDTSIPGVAEFLAAMKTYAPGLNPNPTLMDGWVSAQMFAAAAANISATPTSEEILKGLWRMKNETLNGQSQPLTFTEGHNPPRTFCYWALQIKSGQVVSDNKPSCGVG